MELISLRKKLILAGIQKIEFSCPADKAANTLKNF